MNKLYDILYKIDTAGHVRIWRMEQEGSKHRTIAGVQGGKLVTSGWTQCKATNCGRSNERDPVAQATFDIACEYKKNLERDYFETVEDARGGARYFEPMLAQKYEEFQRGYAQPKLDGIRCIARATGLWSRGGKPILGAPHIMDALMPLFAKEPNLILDGELYNHDLKDDFNTIVSVVKKQKPSAAQQAQAAKLVQYHVYDIPSYQMGFGLRLARLYDLVEFDHFIIQLVDTHKVTSKQQYDELHGAWIEAGYEGSMWRADAPYEQKRSAHLRKRKEFTDAEFPVERIEAGKGNWAGVAKRVICRLPDGREFGAGIRGTRERAASLLHEKHKVATIRYPSLTPDGIPRFAVATKFHGKARTL